MFDEAAEAPAVPPTKKRSLFKNRPTWAAKDYSPQSSDIKAQQTPLAATNGQPTRPSPSNAQDENFFSRSEDTLRRYERPTTLDSTSPGASSKRRAHAQREPAVQSDADDDIDNRNLKNGEPGLTPKKRPRLGSSEGIEAPKNSNGERKTNNNVINDDSEDLYGPPPVREPSVVEPVLIASENENLADIPSSPSGESMSSDLVVIQSVEADVAPRPALREREESPPPEAAATKQPTPPARKLPTPPKFDPVLAILITSRIPDTQPLIARRHYQQRLKEVLEHWCRRNQLSDSDASAVFLLWRGKRVFDFTTCKSLGIQINEVGEVWINGQCQPPGLEGSQIQMEAVTTEIQEEIRREKEEQRAKAHLKNGTVAEDIDIDMDDKQAQSASPKKESQARIILRSKDYEDYKLVVRESTPFSRIIRVFCKARNVPPDKTVSLMFEGERLNPDQELKDSEVGHRDFIDVYIR